MFLSACIIILSFSRPTYLSSFICKFSCLGSLLVHLFMCSYSTCTLFCVSSISKPSRYNRRSVGTKTQLGWFLQLCSLKFFQHVLISFGLSFSRHTDFSSSSVSFLCLDDVLVQLSHHKLRLLGRCFPCDSSCWLILSLFVFYLFIYLFRLVGEENSLEFVFKNTWENGYGRTQRKLLLNERRFLSFFFCCFTWGKKVKE